MSGGRPWQREQQVLDLPFGQRSRLDARLVWLLARLEQLHRSYTVFADRGQELERISAGHSELGLNPSPNQVAVR
jgi:hypothetical protein